MTSAFLLLAPLAPYAALRGCEPVAPPALMAMPQDTETSSPHPCRPPGTPACPDTGGPSPLSDREARKAARGWECKPLETPGWKLLMADHFVLRGDVAPQDLRVAGACLEAFFDTFEATIGGDTSDLMFSARIFSDPHDFQVYASCVGAKNAESFYDPKGAELVLCLDRTRNRAWLQKTLAHEFTHEYMDRVWHRTGPLWFAEGMAEYFTHFRVEEGGIRPGAVDPDVLRRLRESDPVPLPKFLKLGREEFYGTCFPALYAQAWSLVHYLFSKNDGTIDLLLRGEQIKEVEQMERGWKEYVKGLK